MKKNLWTKFSLIILPALLLSIISNAHEWSEHLDDIQRLEKGIYKYQQELDVLVDRKKKTRDAARIEETLQRIVEIHAELIALRQDLDKTKKHIGEVHPEQVGVLDNLNLEAKPKKKKRLGTSPLDRQLDDLLIKIQLKFATFMQPEDKKDEMIEVEEVVKVKKRKKKEREADVYLRRKSKVKLVK
ncbi:MAG: hypothetical protein HRT44_05635 [Bdellovibrionales bacterium]|nr:hypothetical protein [Bdellovibrionales bacterium]NQZ18725.1 hypothetical protein [Bdellovibrionales bacterium]